MKTRTTIFLFIFFFSSIIVKSQTAEEIGIIKNNLVKIFELSIDKNYAEAAKLMAIETDKNGISLIDVNNRKNFNFVTRTCKSINALVSVSNVYEIDTPFAELYNEHNTIAVAVHFKSGDQVINRKFRFVKIEEKYFLIKVD